MTCRHLSDGVGIHLIFECTGGGMSKELFEQITPARIYLGVTVVVGLLVAVATIAQMVILSKIVDRVFVGGEDFAAVTTQILALLGAWAAPWCAGPS